MRYQPLSLSRLASRKIKDHLPPTHSVVLFGSFAKGTSVPTSDIDLGIVGPDPVPLELMSRIRDALDTLPTIRKIDLVDLERSGKDYKKNILAYAKPL